MIAPDDPALRPHPRPGSRRGRAAGLWGGALLAGLAAAPAWAQDPCDGAVTQADLNECTAAADEAADEELNRAYRAAVAAARQYDSWPEGRAEPTLRAAQRGRVAYRDAAREAEAARWDGGSAQPMIRSGCLERLTLLRTDDLWAHAEN